MPTTTSPLALLVSGTPRSGFVQHCCFGTRLVENNGRLGTRLRENGLTLFENSPRIRSELD